MAVANNWSKSLLLAAFSVAVCIIAYRDPYYAGIIAVIAIAAMLTMGVSLSAYAGVLMFGTGGLYGVGAYSYANMCLLGLPTFLALVVAAAAATVVGFAMIMVSLRLRGIYFALSTLIGNLILSAMFLNLNWLTGGPRGMSNIPPPAIWLPGLGDVTFTGYWQTYLVLGLLVVWLYISWRIVHGKAGLYLEAIRHDDTLSMTLGIDILKYRLLAFLPSAAVMGVAGGLYAGYTSAISPADFDIFLSFTILTFVSIGGRARFLGPIIAAIVLSATVYLFQPIYAFRNLVYGILLIVITLLSPEILDGIVKYLRLPWPRYPR